MPRRGGCLPQVLLRRARRGGPTGADRQTASGLFRRTRPPRHVGAGRCDRLCPRPGTAGTVGRQAERHRIDGHGVRPGLSGPAAGESVGRGRLDGQSLFGRRQPGAVRPGGQTTRRRRLRTGQDLESGRETVPGSGRRRTALVSARGRVGREPGGADTGRGRLRRRGCGDRRDVPAAVARTAVVDAAQLVPGARLWSARSHRPRRGRRLRRQRLGGHCQQFAGHHFRALAKGIPRPVR